MTPFIGNKAIRRLLAQSQRRGTLHHAYIFSGPEGVGKKRLGIDLAKSLNCREDIGALEYCGRCPSCHKIESGNHPDVQLIEPETKVFRVDQVRQLIQDISFRPFEGQRRVFILDEADRMNDEAANSLLKTLEEPPDKNILILITTSLYALLPTIRSRGQILKFQAIHPREIEEYLRESAGRSAEEAAKAARLSQGSLGIALSLDMAATTALQAAAFHLLEQLTQTDDAGLMEQLADIVGQTEHFDLFLQILISILRDLVIMDCFRDREHILYYEFLDTLKALRYDLTPVIVERILHDIEDLYRKRHLNIKMDTYFQNIMLRIRATILRRQRA
jgi:DNA polymerase-3 subunit delta'